MPYDNKGANAQYDLAWRQAKNAPNLSGSPSRSSLVDERASWPGPPKSHQPPQFPPVAAWFWSSIASSARPWPAWWPLRFPSGCVRSDAAGRCAESKGLCTDPPNLRSRQYWLDAVPSHPRGWAGSLHIPNPEKSAGRRDSMDDPQRSENATGLKPKRMIPTNQPIRWKWNDLDGLHVLDPPNLHVES